MTKADQILDNRSRLLADIEAGKYQLRFNLSCIKAADISSQYFCEKAVELDFVRGKPETEAIKTGTEGHEALTELAEKVPLERLVKNSLQKKSYTALNFPVWGRFQDVPILGRPDEVEFQNGSVTMVTENKFSSRLYPYNHYRVQAQLYCLLLESMGYDTSSTQYQIRIFQPRCSSCIELLTYRCPIFKPNRRSNHYECAYGAVKTFTYDYEKEDIVDDLEWSLNFWLRKREAIPTRKAWKCKGCGFGTSCAASLLSQAEAEAKEAKKLSLEKRKQRYLQLRAAGATPSEAKRLRDCSYDKYLQALTYYREKRNA